MSCGMGRSLPGARKRLEGVRISIHKFALSHVVTEGKFMSRSQQIKPACKPRLRNRGRGVKNWGLLRKRGSGCSCSEKNTPRAKGTRTHRTAGVTVETTRRLRSRLVIGPFIVIATVGIGGKLRDLGGDGKEEGHGWGGGQAVVLQRLAASKAGGFLGGPHDGYC